MIYYFNSNLNRIILNCFQFTFFNITFCSVQFSIMLFRFKSILTRWTLYLGQLRVRCCSANYLSQIWGYLMAKTPRVHGQLIIKGASSNDSANRIAARGCRDRCRELAHQLTPSLLSNDLPLLVKPNHALGIYLNNIFH